MADESNHTVDFLLKRLEQAGLEYTLINYLNRPVRSMFQYQDERENGLAFYIGLNSAEIGHLRDCTLLCRPELEGIPETVTAIKTPHPRLAFYRLSLDFAPPPPPPGIHPTAIISPEADVHPEAFVGPYCVVERCRIGARAVLVSQVSVLAGSDIGERTRVEPGSCIGASGVVWAWGRDGTQWEMAQFGGVRIGADCFIGSNVSIVRGSLKNTIIGDRCHIAHGSMLGHDVQIGEAVHLANNVALGGGVEIGDGSFLGSGCSCRPAARIASGSIVGNGAAVAGQFDEPGQVLVGVPARPLERKNKSPAGVPGQFGER